MKEKSKPALPSCAPSSKPASATGAARGGAHNEASIRYLNLKDNLPWHTGTGGGSGEKNFFVWNQTNGIVWTIEPSGAPTLKGIPARATAPDVNRLKPLLVDSITGKIYRGE